MTIKKLFAGALALAMTVAILPTSFVSAVTPPNDGYTYLYYENFNDSSTTYDTGSAMCYKAVAPKNNAMQRWDNKHSIIGANKYMKYSVDSAVSVNVNNAAVLNTELSGYKVVPGKLYEAGYKFAPSTYNGVMNAMQLLRFQGTRGALDLSGIEVEKVTIGGKEVDAVDFSDGKITIAGLDIILRDVDGFITVRTIFNMVDSKTQLSEATTIVEYKKKDKTVVTHTENWSFSSYVKIGKLQFLANNFSGMYIEEYSSSIPGTAVSGEFHIDDIYVRELNTYSVTFDNNRSGEEHATEVVSTNYDYSVTPPDMKWDGHKIVDWVDENGDPFDLTNVTETGKTAYAVWKETYKVTYNTMIPPEETQQYYPPDGEAVEDEWKVSPEPMKAEELLRSGWKFDGWYEGDASGCDFETPFDPDNVTEEKYVYAKWIQSHTVTFKAPEADVAVDTYSFAKDGTSLAENDVTALPEPVRKTHTFIGWVKEDGSEFTIDTVVDGPLTLTAVWEPKWAITLNTRGGDELEPYYVTKGESVKAEELPKPTRKGFGFMGWYTDIDYNTAVAEVIEVDGDMTLYAKWNNVIYSENFEYTSDATRKDATNAYMAGLAPTEEYREQLIAEGAGIILDPFKPSSGNHVFRVGAEGSKTIYKSFENAGDGVYEVSYKIRKTGYNHGGSFAAPRIKDHTYRSLGVGGTYMSYVYVESGTFQTWIGGNMAIGWIDAVVRYDTINNTVGIYMTWTNAAGKLQEHKVENLHFHENQQPLDKNGNRKEGYEGIDGLALISTNFASNGVHSPVLSDIYIDDIVVKKIDPPFIKEATVDGKVTEADKMTEKTELSPEIKLVFSEKLDAESVSDDTVYLTEKGSETKIPINFEVTHDDNTSIVTIVPRSPLTYSGEYTVHATNYIKSEKSYFIDNTYTYDFKVRPEIYEVEAALSKVITGDDGETLEPVTTLEGIGPGDKLRATLAIENYAGNSTEEYFVGVSIVNTATGRQIAHKSSAGTISFGEKKPVLTADFEIDTWLGGSCVAEYSIWRSVEERTALYKMVELP